VRALTNRARVLDVMTALGREAHRPTHVYFTGGATAVLMGWRPTTIDIDIKIVPDSDELLRAVSQLKDSLNVNIELAAPDDFIPVREDWAARSETIAQHGAITFHHFDLYAQALAKIERGHDQDQSDVRTMIDRGLIDRQALRDYFDRVKDKLYRYPAIDAKTFASAVARAAGDS
jgi:hypothetical protein